MQLRRSVKLPPSNPVDLRRGEGQSSDGLGLDRHAYSEVEDVLHSRGPLFDTMSDIAMDRTGASWNRRKHSYGYIPDLGDIRDLEFQPSAAAVLPVKVDLRGPGAGFGGMPSVYDQGQLGSCTANALCNAFRFAGMNQPHAARRASLAFSPSRLFLYYQERKIEGTVETDSGAMIRDGAAALKKVGVCAESTYPYVIEHFAAKPSAKAVAEAGSHESISYLRVALNHLAMRSCLAQGFPFVIGFTVYESFESDAVSRTGIVPMPGKKETTLGGHAVLVCGYDDEAKTYLVQNSWGTGWGMAGYFTVPQAYFENTNLASDAWTIRSVER